MKTHGLLVSGPGLGKTRTVAKSPQFADHFPTEPRSTPHLVLRVPAGHGPRRWAQSSSPHDPNSHSSARTHERLLRLRSRLPEEWPVGIHAIPRDIPVAAEDPMPNGRREWEKDWGEYETVKERRRSGNQAGYWRSFTTAGFSLSSRVGRSSSRRCDPSRTLAIAAGQRGMRPRSNRTVWSSRILELSPLAPSSVPLCPPASCPSHPSSSCLLRRGI